MALAYKRIMLKLSGEVLEGTKDYGMDFHVIQNLCKEIAEVHKLGVEIAIVIGGGNIWRYRDSTGSGIERVISDNIGMLATIMNGVAMQAAFEDLGVHCRVCSAIDIPQLAEPYLRRRAVRHLEKDRIVVCAGGTGNPYFTTDSAAALRALELNADALLKATKVDGVYDKDPVKHKDAKFYEKIHYSDVLKANLKVMDATAVSLCRDGDLPIKVFNLNKKGNIKKIIEGKKVGTTIH